MVPLRPGKKKPAGEHLPDGKVKNLSEQPLSPEQIGELISRFPGLGWGVLLADLCLVDYDTEEVWVAYPAPVTPTVRTDRGYQTWFYRPRGLKLTNRTLAPDLELRATGYAILPGHVHRTGTVYSWVPGLSILDVRPADLPAWVMELYMNPKVAKTRGAEQSTGPRQAVAASMPGGLPPQVRALLDDDEMARRLLARHDIEYHVGEAFRCILPGHEEAEPSASIWRTPDGLLIYRDFHQRDKRSSYLLTDAYAATVTGRVRLLRRGERVAWAIRMLADLGLLELPELEPPPEHPPITQITEAATMVWRGTVLLARCRLVYDSKATLFPLGWSFLAPWCGVSNADAGRAIQELAGLHYLRRAGYQGKLTMYEFGPKARPFHPIAAYPRRPAAWPTPLFGVP